jgi:4-hydroxybenzoate polyprenyltransferase
MLRRARALLDAVQITHTVFALPFALSALLVASAGFPDARTFGLVLACMVAARAAAMAFNRYADREFDATNPRTAARPSVTGSLSPRALLLFTAVCLAALLSAAAALNWTCFFLAFPAMAVLLGYSYAKRFTSLAHFWLGFALGLAPVGAHLAARGDLGPLPDLGARWRLPLEAFPLLLGSAVLCWVAGFDLIYSCQDHAVDSADPRLHSLPKKLGIAAALRLSTLLHVLAALLLLAAGVYAGLGIWYFTAWLMVTILLAVEHWLVRPGDLTRIGTAFYALDAAVSLLLLAAVAVELRK